MQRWSWNNAPIQVVHSVTLCCINKISCKHVNNTANKGVLIAFCPAKKASLHEIEVHSFDPLSILPARLWLSVCQPCLMFKNCNFVKFDNCISICVIQNGIWYLWLLFQKLETEGQVGEELRCRRMVSRRSGQLWRKYIKLITLHQFLESRVLVIKSIVPVIYFWIPVSL